MLQDALIYLGTALVFVPIAKKLGIGSVLGYLIGGILIGPFVLGLIGKGGEDVMHATEFGVVMMLFLIGLEINPKSFWNMRKQIIGLGGLQMALTTLFVFLLFRFLFEYNVNSSFAIALGFAMSSTAIVLQTLKEKGLDKTMAGESAFSILLFQDIAVIPILAILPLFAFNTENIEREGHFPPELDFLNQHQTLTIILAVFLVFIIIKFLINPFLRYVATAYMRELLTMSALFIVIGVSWIMELAGVSAALGAFMAGLILTSSEFKHELESELEPFKGLLLGIFFIAIGTTINFTVIQDNPWMIFKAVALVILIKAVILGILGKIFKLKTDQNILFALLLSQVGEFGFLVLASSGQLGIIDPINYNFLMAVITITMMISPLLLVINEKYIDPNFGIKEKDDYIDLEPNKAEEESKIIIVGFGNFGSTLGRFLRANGEDTVVLENNSDRVALLRKMGFKVFYGDGTRMSLLESAGIKKAKILIAAIDAPEKNLELVKLVKKYYPDLTVFVRAKDRNSAYDLIEMGVDNIYRESLYSSVNMGINILNHLGHRKYTSNRKAQEFLKHDESMVAELAKIRNNEAIYINSTKRIIEFQEKLLADDVKFTHEHEDHAWDKKVMEVAIKPEK
jgi:CPA2 family monovalent cation:H+ antiporter-2